jgi:hypothetical protein
MLASLKRHPKRLRFVFHDIWCIKSLFSSKYMYFSSLLTLLPSVIWTLITYGNFIGRSVSFTGLAGWLGSCRGWLAAYRRRLGSPGWLAGQCLGWRRPLGWAWHI